MSCPFPAQDRPDGQEDRRTDSAFIFAAGRSEGTAGGREEADRTTDTSAAFCNSAKAMFFGAAHRASAYCDRDISGLTTDCPSLAPPSPGRPLSSLPERFVLSTRRPLCVAPVIIREALLANRCLTAIAGRMGASGRAYFRSDLGPSGAGDLERRHFT